MSLAARPGMIPRVVLLTSPGIFGAEIINRLAVATGIHLVGVGLTNRIYKGKGVAAGVRTFLQRTGWRYLLYNALQSHVAWTWLRMTGRPTALKRVPGEARLLTDVNSPETIDWLRSLQPDFVASFYFNQWIGPEVRSVPTHGAVNMHPSLLPTLRGPDPIFRTIERGLKSSGYTIHRVADEIDGGSVLHQEACAIPAGLTAFGLYLKMIRDGGDLLARWLAGAVPSGPHFRISDGVGDYLTFPTPAEVKRFFDTGHRLIRISECRAALADVR
jgi:hypothetical protein